MAPFNNASLKLREKQRANTDTFGVILFARPSEPRSPVWFLSVSGTEMQDHFECPETVGESGQLPADFSELKATPSHGASPGRESAYPGFVIAITQQHDRQFAALLWQSVEDTCQTAFDDSRLASRGRQRMRWQGPRRLAATTAAQKRSSGTTR